MGVREDGYTLGQELSTILSLQESNIYSDKVLEKLAVWHYTRGVAQGSIVTVPLERFRRIEDPRSAFITAFIRGFRGITLQKKEKAS